jgi:hypothetical protein
MEFHAEPAIPIALEEQAEIYRLYLWSHTDPSPLPPETTRGYLAHPEDDDRDQPYGRT